MSSGTTVLIVEDDARLAAMVSRFLTGEGYTTAIEGRGDAALDRILEEVPDAVLLDVRLPGRDGMVLCRSLRPAYTGAILMMTARGDEVDEVLGLEFGADDFLAKPVRPRVLLARLKAALRRSDPPPSVQVVHVGALVVDPTRREARLDQRDLGLSTAEFDLLHLLARRVGTPVDRDTLYRELDGIAYDGWDRTMDLRVSRLRRKLDDDAEKPAWIRSVRGVGYLLKAPV